MRGQWAGPGALFPGRATLSTTCPWHLVCLSVCPPAHAPTPFLAHSDHLGAEAFLSCLLPSNISIPAGGRMSDQRPWRTRGAGLVPWRDTAGGGNQERKGPAQSRSEHWGQARPAALSSGNHTAASRRGAPAHLAPRPAGTLGPPLEQHFCPSLCLRMTHTPPTHRGPVQGCGVLTAL